MEEGIFISYDPDSDLIQVTVNCKFGEYPVSGVSKALEDFAERIGLSRA